MTASRTREKNIQYEPEYLEEPQGEKNIYTLIGGMLK